MFYSVLISVEKEKFKVKQSKLSTSGNVREVGTLKFDLFPWESSDACDNGW